MTWREKTVAKFLLLVAKMLADDPQLQKDISTLATEISVHAPKRETEAS